MPKQPADKGVRVPSHIRYSVYHEVEPPVTGAIDLAVRIGRLPAGYPAEPGRRPLERRTAVAWPLQASLLHRVCEVDALLLLITTRLLQVIDIILLVEVVERA